MPWTQKQMLRDANGDLIPQYWDVAEQTFKPLTGSDGANDVRLTGSNVELTVFENIEVAAGTTVLSNQIDLRDFNEYYIFARAGGDSTIIPEGFYFVLFSEDENGRTFISRDEETENGLEGHNRTRTKYLNEPFRIMSSYGTLRLINNTSESVELNHVTLILKR